MFNIPSLVAPKALHPTNTNKQKNNAGHNRPFCLFFLILPVCCLICNHVFFMCFCFVKCEMLSCPVETFLLLSATLKISGMHIPIAMWMYVSFFKWKNIFLKVCIHIAHSSRTHFLAFSQPYSDLYTSIVTASHGTTCWSDGGTISTDDDAALGFSDKGSTWQPHLFRTCLVFFVTSSFLRGGINNYMYRHPLQYQVKVLCVVNDSSPENLHKYSELETIFNYVRGLLWHNLVPNLKRMLILHLKPKLPTRTLNSYIYIYI